MSKAAAENYLYGVNKTVIGALKKYTVKEDESLIEIARKFGLGYNEIIAANPTLDPFVPGDEAIVDIPSSWILPDMTPYHGIIINLSEKRLYFFPQDNTRHTVMTFPIGIGRQGNETPEGVFQIIAKTVNPVWYAPESIRQESPNLPKAVPPGPNNPLGSYALKLSEKSILIHGTNRPYAVGRKSSHGCIRLYPEDIPELFRAVPEKTKVTILRQPVKAGISDGRVYLEVHKDDELDINYFDTAVRLLKKKNLYTKIDKEKMLAALREKKGFPSDITKEEPSALKN